MKPLSIITPTLDSIKTIEKNLESISSQKNIYFEHIVIDGYSSDGTVEFIQDYKGHEIIFLNEDEKGIYQAINQGIRASSGEFIMLLNSDDWLPPRSLEIINNQILEHQSNVHIFSSDVYEDNKRIASVYPIKDFNLPIQKMPFSHGAMIASKDFLLKKGLYSNQYSLSSDLDFVNNTCSDDYKFHDDIIHCFSLEGASSQNFKGSKESMNIAINYGKNPLLAKLFFLRVVVNKLAGKIFSFSTIIKIKKFLRYSSNWK